MITKDLEGFFGGRNADALLDCVKAYVVEGGDARWKTLEAAEFPEYGSPLDALAEAVDVGDPGAGEGDVRERLMRVLACFLRPAGLATWLRALGERLGDEDGWFDELVELVPENLAAQFHTSVLVWGSKELPNGSPNAIGAYFLRRNFERLHRWMSAGLDQSAGLVASFAGFLTRHDPEMMRANWREMAGRVDPEEKGDVVAELLYFNGIVEAEDAFLAGVERCGSEFKRFLALRDACGIDLERHRGRTREAALESLGGSGYKNNHQVPAVWLAEHFPEEAVSLLSEKIRNAENDPDEWANWGGVAYRAMETLGEGGREILQACAETTLCITVWSGAAGAIAGGIQPPDETVANMLRRLVKVDELPWVESAIGAMVKWAPGEFAGDIDELATHDNPQVRRVAKLAQLALALQGLGSDDERNAARWDFVRRELPRELSDLVERHLAPCLYLRSCEEPPGADGKSSAAAFTSHFGGAPLLPTGIGWPAGADGRRLPFVAKLGEDDVRRVEPEFAGDLLFFADWENEACRVIHCPDGVATEPVRGGDGYRYVAITCEAGRCFPRPDDPWDAWRFASSNLGEGAGDSLSLVMQVFGGNNFQEERAVHRVFGYPLFVQHSPVARATQDFEPRISPPPAEEQWVSLLSLVTDETAGIAFHDTGTMTFLLPRRDWEQRKFDQVVLNVDCC